MAPFGGHGGGLQQHLDEIDAEDRRVDGAGRPEQDGAGGAAEAGCRFLGMEVDAPILDGQPVQNGHAELSARYRWQCAQPEHLKSVGTTLFADYKRLHKIKAVFAGPRGQHGATLGRKTPTFRW